ncbi:MAG: neutral/alkaline non-lysosomal ceramidase N-terminal domain-containing protein [Candidatus Helarchaeota archaeon]
MSNNCLIGFAKSDITPKTRVKMGGYGYRKGKSTGVHDQLYAHAIYFSYNKIEIAMVSLDILGLFNIHVNHFRKIIENKTGIPSKNILIHCVHNHSAPDAVGLTDLKGFFKKTIKDDVIHLIGKGIINAVIKAKQNAQPSKVGAGKIDSEKRLIINRRDPLKDAKYQIGVIRIDDMNGNLRGLIINYACHGTVLPSSNNLITADYIGQINHTIQELSNNSVFSLYFNGTCGDVNPNLFDFDIKLEDIDKSILYDGPGGAKGSFKRAWEIGSSIARTAWDLAQKITTKEIDRINVHYKQLLVPIDDIIEKNTLKNHLKHIFFQLKQKLMMGLRKIGNLSNYNFIKTSTGLKMKTEIQLIQINDILFPALPGEFFLNLGEKILNESPSKNTFLIELANDCAGYFFSISDYFEGGYEQSMSFCPKGGTYIINKMIKLIKSSYLQ